MATLLIDRVAQRLGQSAAANTNFPTKMMIVNSLNEGAKEVARKLTPYAIPEHIKESVVSASKTQGLAIPSDYIKDVQVYLSSTYANVRRVPTFLKFLLKDSTSMHYAKTDDMAYYFRQNRIIVEPSGSISASSFTIVYVAEPAACSSGTNESYASWNRDVENLAIDYGVIRGKESQLGDYSEKMKTALALAKTRAVSAVSTIGGYSFSISNFVSSVSWPTTRVLYVLNAASRAVSILTTQITADDFEKGGQYILQASEYLKQATSELSRENTQIDKYRTWTEKEVNKNRSLLDKASGKLQAAIAEVQVATTYIQNNPAILGEIKALEEKFDKRIADINSRFARAG